MVEAICKACNNPFKVKPYRLKVAKFCSMKCKGTEDRLRMLGNKFREGIPAWNKDMKGLHLSPDTEFKKGHNTWNKNLKGIHLSEKSEFKKGRISETKEHIGTIKIRQRGSLKRQYIKVSEPNVWMLNARYVYSQYAEILPKMVIHHINHNPMDDRIENLQMLTRSEHAKIHHLSRY